MSLTRVQAIVDADGELHLRGLPVQKGQRVEVIVLADGVDDDTLVAMLQTDPGWSWLRDPAEDIYSEADVRRLVNLLEAGQPPSSVGPADQPSG